MRQRKRSNGGEESRRQSDRIARRHWVCVGWTLLSLFVVMYPIAITAQASQVTGTVTDPAGRPVANASVEILKSGGVNAIHIVSDALGRFQVNTDAEGIYTLQANGAGLWSAAQVITIDGRKKTFHVDLALTRAPSESIAVKATVSGVDLHSPDPTEKVFVQQDLIDANPGRPGVPVSVPGYPVETASGGIKAPQYFAPGVAGDHGEPIAQFIALGGYLVPNNLSANAHGNGYADPNLLIAPMLAYAQVDGGSFNVLEGNHAVNQALTYGLRGTSDRFVALSGDRQDVDAVAVVAGGKDGWLAFEGGYGNGFLRRLEHRQQYKGNGERVAELGAHRISILGIGYYGSSYVPGLVPIGPLNTGGSIYTNWGDTVDPRQRDQTHTTLVAATDTWTLGNSQQMQFSGFFRTYNLSLYSDFGQGLIRQSEFRTVAGGNAEYLKDVPDRISLLAGVDVQREAPRNDDLFNYGFYTAGDMSDGHASLIDSANVTITPVAPFAGIQARLGKYLRAYAAWRRDEIDFNNQDLVHALNSFHQWIGVNSPKATVSAACGSAKWAPIVSASGGESFFTDDPRIGTGTTRGTPVSRAHAYQLVATEPLGHTEIRLSLGQTTMGEQLAKIDPDTGLQENQGPGRVRYLTGSVRQSFSAGSLLATFSKADARDLDGGQPTAEAPRTIADVLGALEKLPLKLQAKAEFEYVGAKPLGTGCLPNPNLQCIGVPVKELRAAMARSFDEGRFIAGVNLLVASGYTGQTLETFWPSIVPQPTGVRSTSFASGSFSYRFGGGMR